MVNFITMKKEGMVKIIIQIPQRRKSLLKNIKWLAQGHTNIN